MEVHRGKTEKQDFHHRGRGGTARRRARGSAVRAADEGGEPSARKAPAGRRGRLRRGERPARAGSEDYRVGGLARVLEGELRGQLALHDRREPRGRARRSYAVALLGVAPTEDGRPAPQFVVV